MSLNITDERSSIMGASLQDSFNFIRDANSLGSPAVTTIMR